MTADYKKRVADVVGSPIAAPGYERYSGVYFFLSLDLVNSTAYKADHADWKFRTRMFYDDARNFWTNHRLNFTPQVWKYAGDEVLFYSRIYSISQLQAAVEASYRAVRSVSATVQSWTKSARTRLYVKGTCWAAYASYTNPSAEKDLPVAGDADPTTRNLIFQPVLGAGGAVPVLDFLGPEIDAGFRISGGSMKNALVVSAEVASAIRTEGVREHGNRFRVVDFRELKGVWNGRHYPLIWYREDWTDKALNEDYEYDDRFKSELLNKVYAAKPESVDQVDTILRHVGRTWLVRALPADRVADAVEPEASDAAIVRGPGLQVHCVAVCISDTGKVLVAKRKDSKTVHPNCWEVGCAQLHASEDFYAAMKRDYFADFGVELDFAPFNEHGAIGTYSFTKDRSTIPGVIFVARVAGEPTLLRSKHAEVAWVDPKDLEAVTQGETVPDLSIRVQRAFELWAKVRGEVHDGSA